MSGFASSYVIIINAGNSSNIYRQIEEIKRRKSLLLGAGEGEYDLDDKTITMVDDFYYGSMSFTISLIC